MAVKPHMPYHAFVFLEAARPVGTIDLTIQLTVYKFARTDVHPTLCGEVIKDTSPRDSSRLPPLHSQDNRWETLWHALGG